MAKTTGIVIGILVLNIEVLGIFLVYAFAVKPVISGYVTEGVEIAVVSIMQQATTCQTVPLTYGNQTIDLIWTKCVEELLRQQTQPQG